MEEETPPYTKRCKNCRVVYNLKGGAPEICWICGLPIDEEINIEELYK